MLHELKSPKKGNAPKPPKKSGLEPTPSETPKRLNAYGRALAFTSMALVFGVIEIVLFSAVAALFGVDVSIATMPLAWLIVFYSLFLIPGLCLFIALMHISSMFE
jgi:hypothetical protein